MMTIISHRGAWAEDDEKNTVAAFEKSFNNGFGTETDIRDYKGELVISHDMATEESITVAYFFELYKNAGYDIPLALNIKSDGLQKPVKDLIEKYSITNYFFFDMSVPDTLGYVRHGLDFYTRQSEYEPAPALYYEAKGIWLDCFKSVWYNESVINNHLKNDKAVAIVSPDLHKREYKEFWAWLKSSGIYQSKNVILCTDFPFEAKQFFED